MYIFTINKCPLTFKIAPNGTDPFYNGLYTFFTGEENAFDLALVNLWNIGFPIIQEINTNWILWEQGVAPQGNTSFDILGRLTT